MCIQLKMPSVEAQTRASTQEHVTKAGPEVAVCPLLQDKPGVRTHTVNLSRCLVLSVFLFVILSMSSLGASAQENATKAGPKVVVVGAGFAGLGAARKLIKGGITDVTLIEAKETPGGRAQTVNLNGGFVELGAQYLHGESEIYFFAKEHGLLLDENEGDGDDDDYDDDDDGDDDDDEDRSELDSVFQYVRYTFRTPDGVAMKKKLVKHNLELMEEMLGDLDDIDTEEAQQNLSVSVGDYLRDLYPEYLPYMNGTEAEKDEMIKWIEAWYILDTASTVNDLSLAGSSRYEYEKGNNVQETKQGMWGVFDLMLNDSIDPSRVLLNKTVKSVLWRNDSLTSGVQPGRSVAVTCADGEVIHADYVIVTPSVGVLKKNQDLFTPALPPTHREAINTMGFGDVAKVFLIWDVDQGPTEMGVLPNEINNATQTWFYGLLGGRWGMALLWPDQLAPIVNSSKTHKLTTDGKQWYQDIALMEFTPSYHPCLLVWVHGEGGTIMETLKEAEVKDVLYEIMVMFLNRTSLTKPTSLIRSMWSSNPYTLGAYSHVATGTPLELQEILGQPLPSAQNPVLQIAGEATSTTFYGTAHGALYSGEQAADNILKHHNAQVSTGFRPRTSSLLCFVAFLFTFLVFVGDCVN